MRKRNEESRIAMRIPCRKIEEIIVFSKKERVALLGVSDAGHLVLNVFAS
jgi:hypothetical protein